MFTRLLIANRGEIACRVIRAAKELGIYTIAVYSTADAHSLAVSLADEAHCIGSAPSRESYLRGDKILAVAKATRAEAIHPGYGFLSENAEFAKACETAGIEFIGPSSDAITAMGAKDRAKQIMRAAGVPVIPGIESDAQDAETLLAAAENIGFPVLIKASAGGGGKGMRVVNSSSEFREALASAQREAKSSFNDDRMIIEKYLPHARHIEIQVFSDQYDHHVYLFERDCSMQRRKQKVIEEAPAAHFSADLREKMGKTAVAAAKAIQYEGAGTIEFLVTENGEYYFMEMNTRLQVEHPVTEFITRQNLIHWQLKVASGEPLPCTQSELQIHGHAIEVRLYAEDPAQQFAPSIGLLSVVDFPPMARVDSGIRQGDSISMYYDPMIAKLIVWGETRELAIAKLQQALDQSFIVGVKTNLHFLCTLAHFPLWLEGKANTHTIDDHGDELTKRHYRHQSWALAIMAWLIIQNRRNAIGSPWESGDAWQGLAIPSHRVDLTWLESDFSLVLRPEGEQWIVEGLDQAIALTGRLSSPHTHSSCKTALVSLDERQIPIRYFYDAGQYELFILGEQYQFSEVEWLERYSHQDSSGGQLTAPMPGTVVAVLAKSGESVELGQGLMVIEAMKIEHTIQAPSKGTISAIHYQVGDQVHEGEELIAFDALD